MKHLGTMKIGTQRLILRPFVPEDGDVMFRNWASDPEVTKYLTWPTHAEPGVSRWVVEDWVSHYKEENFYQWAIVLKDSGEVIGSISVVKMNEEAQWIEIGYCIGRSWWHKGIMSEALGAVMKFFFEQVGARRIQARHDPRNSNSGAVMRKCGMTYEGTLRRSDRNNQGICDAAVYSILWEEYYADK